MKSRKERNLRLFSALMVVHEARKSPVHLNGALVALKRRKQKQKAETIDGARLGAVNFAPSSALLHSPISE
jgi:hypothetical protein